MGWFKRDKEGITTSTKEKRETPEGLWEKCSNCKTIFAADDLKANFYVCDRCNHHERIGSEQYFEILFDDGDFKELNPRLSSADPLKFEDTKKYVDRVKKTQEKTGLKDALRTAHGKIDGHELSLIHI